MTLPSDATPRSATRGLATVALLKVNFDAGRDHISMFEPFVLDTLSHLDADGVTADYVRAAVDERHQLALPVNVVRMALMRAVSRGFQRREGGRYFRTDKTPNLPDLRTERARIEERQGRLAEALREASARRGLEVHTAEEALDMVLDFLESYHVSMALGEEAATDLVPEPATDAPADPKTIVTAGFLREAVLTGGDLADVVQEMLEGFILQNTLLLKDISVAARPFKRLRVFFDSVLLFGALGYEGAATGTAVQELLSLLRDSGASLEVFEPTIREMRRILAVYEDRIGTHEGRLSLYQTDLTRYFLTKHFTPSDIRAITALIDKDIRALGFVVRDLPPHVAELTLDERRLGVLLAAGPGGENVPRVVHDIDCVAGVLTLRRGKTSDSLDHAGVVFVTRSSLTVRHTREWYRDEGQLGFSPILHYLLLSNLAWLKRPTSASRLKLHELVALCTAALRPSREAWQAFLKHLRRLEASGQLSTDEAAAIVASSLTDSILVEEDVGEDTDAATLTEVVDRVKAAYRAEADAELGAVRTAAAKTEAELVQFRNNVDRRARNVATSASWAVAGLLAASFIAGAAIGVARVASGSGPGVVALVLAIIPFAIASLFSVLWGFHVAGWRRRIEDRLAEFLRRWMSGPA